MTAVSHPEKTLNGQDNLLMAILVLTVKTLRDLRGAPEPHFSPSLIFHRTLIRTARSTKKKKKEKRSAASQEARQQGRELTRSINNRLRAGFATILPPLRGEFQQFGEVPHPPPPRKAGAVNCYTGIT